MRPLRYTCDTCPARNFVAEKFGKPEQDPQAYFESIRARAVEIESVPKGVEVLKRGSVPRPLNEPPPGLVAAVRTSSRGRNQPPPISHLQPTSDQDDEISAQLAEVRGDKNSSIPRGSKEEDGTHNKEEGKTQNPKSSGLKRIRISLKKKIRAFNRRMKAQSEIEQAKKDAFWDARGTRRRAERGRAGEEVMGKNPDFEKVLRAQGWQDNEITSFADAVGTQKLILDTLQFRRNEGEFIGNLSPAQREILERGMKIIRSHNTDRERIVRGREKMSEEEVRALAYAVGRTFSFPDGTTFIFSEKDANDFYSLYGGLGQGVMQKLKARHAGKMGINLKDVSAKAAIILEPVWIQQSAERRVSLRKRTSASLKTAHAAWGGRKILRGRTERIKNDLIPELSDVNLQILTLAQLKGRISQSAVDIFKTMWSRTENRGIAVDDVEKKVIREVRAVIIGKSGR